LFLAPTGVPLFAADEEGCDGAATDKGCNVDCGGIGKEGNMCVVFCFFHDAKTVGLGVGSWSGAAVLINPPWLAPPCLHSLITFFKWSISNCS